MLPSISHTPSPLEDDMIQATLVGNLGRDAELKNTGSTDMLKFSVATTEQRTKTTTWVSCVLWGRRAAPLSDYMKKGQQVVVFGTLTNRTWEGKDGERKTLECNVTEVKLVGKREPEATRPVDDAIPF